MIWDDNENLSMNHYTVKTDPPYTCPICGEKSLHFYLNRSRRSDHGGVWVWCSNCFKYSHGSTFIPGWWKNLDSIDQNQLNHSPDYLNNYSMQIDKWIGKILDERISIDDLEYFEEIFSDTHYNGELFTGTAVDIGADGSYEEWNFIEGFGEGICFGLYPNGSYKYYSELSHGIEMLEKEWTEHGILITDNCKNPLMKREYYNNGIPKGEQSEDHMYLWYPDGTLKEEYSVSKGVVVYYAPDGTWFAKLLNEGFPIIFDETKIEFNDVFMRRHYLELLENHEFFYPFFIRWLPKKPEAAGHTPSCELSNIICSMIASDNPEIKYSGINLARDYRVVDAIPLLKKEKSSRIIPKGGESHGYADTIGKRARIALSSLKSDKL